MTDESIAAACPFCGHLDLHLSSNGVDNQFVVCNQCGAEGPSHETEPIAIKEWNRRASPEVLRASSGSLISLDAALGCVPGGSVCDPQVIADSLRELVAAGPLSPSPDLSTRNTLSVANQLLCDHITYYLSNGGLFNPEMANHGAVRDLLIACRAALADQSDFRGLKRDEGPTADAATGAGNTQGTEP